MKKLLKINFLNLILYLLLVGIFTGIYIQIGIEELHLIRVILPIAFLISFGFKFKADKFLIIFILFNLAFFVTTIISSLIYSSETQINDIFNLVVVTLLNLTLIVWLYNNPVRFLKTLYYTSLFFIFFLFIIAIYEVVFLQHLTYSKLNDLSVNEWWHHAPTGLYYNQNDFATVFSFIAIFILATHCLFKYKMYRWINLFVFAMWCWVCIVTESRICLIVFLLSLYFFLLRIYILKRFLYLITFVLIVIAIALNYYLSYKLADYLGTGEQVSSFQVRGNLYVYGLKSIIDSKGFGFGINNFDTYFENLYGSKVLFNDVLTPHSYLFEILLDGGLLPVIIFLIMYFRYTFNIFKSTKDSFLRLFVLNYIILTFSTSHWVFIWPFYLFFIGYYGLLVFSNGKIISTEKI